MVIPLPSTTKHPSPLVDPDRIDDVTFVTNRSQRPLNFVFFQLLSIVNSTYDISIWGSAQAHRLNAIQSRYMRLLRSSLDISWFLRNEKILKEIPILPSAQTTPVAAARLRRTLESHHRHNLTQ